MNYSDLKQVAYFPSFITFFPKLHWYSQRSYNSKNQQIPKQPEDPNYMSSTVLNCLNQTYLMSSKRYLNGKFIEMDWQYQNHF